jgi:branched-chain amino acid transport system permease protein
VLRYRLAAYVLAGCVCALAGLMLANLAEFATPAYMAWTLSGELIVMVVLGGTGTVVGPLLGAVTLLSLEEMLPGVLESLHPAWKQHWMLVLGPLIVLIVLLGRQGVYGLLARRRASR